MSLINWFREKFKDLNLFYKFQIALFIVSIITLSVMVYFSYNEGKKLLTERSFDLLINITENKRKIIETYFLNLKNQISTFAENPSTKDALKDYVTGFRSHPPLSGTDSDSTLKKYYQQNFLELWRYNTLKKSINESYIPINPSAQALQYKYIVENPNPIFYKYRLSIPANVKREKYDLVHERYHPSFLKIRQKFELSDIILIDDRGNIVYTTSKKIDFSQNVLNNRSPLHNTNLGELYRQLMQSHNEDPVMFKDYDSYPPDFGTPSCFIGIPIFEPVKNRTEGGEKIGTLIFQVSNDKITSLLTNNLNWAGEGLGTTGEIAMVGSDFKLRNNTRRFLEDPTFYTTNLLRNTKDTATVEKIKRQKTTIMLREYKTQATMDALNGKNGHEQNIDFLGSEVLDVFMPINILNTRWAMITEMDGSEMFRSTIVFRNQLLIIALLLFVFITLLAAYLAKSLAEPMRKIQREVTMLAEGVFPKITSHIYRDELGKIDEAMNKLISNMREVATFAENIGKENFDYPFQPKNEKDILGNALVSMRDSLKQLSEDEHQRSWISTGKASFAEILRKSSESLEQMGNAVTFELVKYLHANQGAFFIWDEKIERLNILSLYAYDRRKYLQKSIQAGEGLVGQVFLEKTHLYLTEVPQDYADISSGLGFARPRCILLMPIQANNQVFGILEIASFNLLKPHEISFVASICEDVALTITNLKNTEETKRLLAEQQKITAQLRQQEEEMRQNFEELMATQEEMKLRQEKIELLLNGEASLDELQGSDSWITNGNLFIPTDKRIQDAIQRQKEMLDEAFAQNKLREQIIRNRVDKNNGKENSDTQ
jgi:methyl-accepting chemotaxis protein